MIRVLPAVVSVLALVLAGCTSQPAPATTDDPLDPASTGAGDGGLGNNTTLPPPKPPVARMQIFDTGGALAYESNFVAENATAQNPVHGGGNVTFLASASEAVDKTATVTKWEWDFGDGGRASGRGVSHAFRDTGGIFRVTLTVTDSHNTTDSLWVVVGALPTRSYTVPVDFAGALQAGTLSQASQDGLDAAAHAFEIVSSLEGFAVVVESATLTLLADGAAPTDAAADYDLYVYDPDGNLTAADAGGSLVGPEPAAPSPGGASVSLGAGAAPGAYVARVVLHAGVQSGYTLHGEVVYRVVNPQVEAQFGGAHH